MTEYSDSQMLDWVLEMKNVIRVADNDRTEYWVWDLRGGMQVFGGRNAVFLTPRAAIANAMALMGVPKA